ncbi:hypothetical protein HLB23_28275 [Nocardia uniformis]|uniref:Uncharacterized protein n=1 Tax=Nocardia uniformis TaxID=53432 RepID=A0A849C4S8_9NOCA|nr:hypothetical protein [Nocardia uniformis]NNH73704.1 hypothetical protein [Nocardia uniformis]
MPLADEQPDPVFVVKLTAVAALAEGHDLESFLFGSGFQVRLRDAGDCEIQTLQRHFTDSTFSALPAIVPRHRTSATTHKCNATHPDGRGRRRRRHAVVARCCRTVAELTPSREEFFEPRFRENNRPRSPTKGRMWEVGL